MRREAEGKEKESLASCDALCVPPNAVEKEALPCW